MMEPPGSIISRFGCCIKNCLIQKHPVMKVTEVAVLQLLKRYKINVTQNRIRVLYAILSMKGVVSASSIHAETYINADRVTIYRTLKVFEKKGLLQLVANTLGKVEFCIKPGIAGIKEIETVYARSVCTACGTQVLLDFPKAANIEGMYGFDPSEILIRGLCRSCKFCG